MGNQPIKVLHVVGQMNRGGTETLLMNLLRCTDRSRFQYDFVEQTNAKCDYDDEILSLGSQIFRCPAIGVRNFHAYRMWWRTFFREHPEYRIIHGHSRGSAPVYLDEANKAGCVTIAHCHNNSFGLGMKGLVRKIWQTPLKTIADYNFACSYESGVSQYGKNGKFEVIKNGILTENFRFDSAVREKKRQEFGIEKNFVIGNVARFEEQKNHLFLIDIFDEIQKICPDARLMLVGKGTLENQIRKKVHSLGLDDKVIFTGLRSDVNELLQAMDVFLMPSHFEGLGMAAVEAQTAGLLTFVSDTVAPEARVTDLIHYVGLSRPALAWAQMVTDEYQKTTVRKDTSAEVTAAGFDIRSTVKDLEQFYCSVVPGEKDY